MKKEILPIEESSKTLKQRKMETTVKNPVGRPKSTVKRYLKAYFLSAEEEIIMDLHYQELKKLRHSNQ